MQPLTPIVAAFLLFMAWAIMGFIYGLNRWRDQKAEEAQTPITGKTERDWRWLRK